MHVCNIRIHNGVSSARTGFCAKYNVDIYIHIPSLFVIQSRFRIDIDIVNACVCLHVYKPSFRTYFLHLQRILTKFVEGKS